MSACVFNVFLFTNHSDKKIIRLAPPLAYAEMMSASLAKFKLHGKGYVFVCNNAAVIHDDASLQTALSRSTSSPFAVMLCTPAQAASLHLHAAASTLSPSVASSSSDASSSSSTATASTAATATVDVRVIASKSDIEDNAVKQLRDCANRLKGVIQAVGMPDLHMGKNFPIGCVFVTREVIYPDLIGSDIGCGMALFQTNIKPSSEKKVERLASRITYDAMEGPCDDSLDRREFLRQFNAEETGAFDDALGTIGRGNHFAELQQVDRVVDAAAFQQLGLDESRLVLLVHSGSRGYGESCLNTHIDQNGSGVGLRRGTRECEAYMRSHDNATRWARANRALIARRLAKALQTDITPIVDITHNFVEAGGGPDDVCFYHRKGATPSSSNDSSSGSSKVVVIPGSRGDFSYVLKPTEDADKHRQAGYSLAHGAGRLLSRADAAHSFHGGLSKSEELSSLRTTKFGSVVICEDSDLLREEAPRAYKCCESIIADLVEHGLVTVVCVLRPVLTYKCMNRASNSREKNKGIL